MCAWQTCREELKVVVEPLAKMKKVLGDNVEKGRREFTPDGLAARNSTQLSAP